ncbi:PREDICTED: stonin-2 isoform X1 [Rhinopithecus bieti]|uniref:Stonin-2 n=1 Tax=Rhinopithecus bieti TaxID=61621 RepID=A0A2K6M0P5_RHIBE|nr:PREDICTED: stonin-2 isoform X1 [Rhinopithecus bieti]XP_017729341.1 PREDICTED: stonin-2 isoform X1 [Rhinopithecus bieti]XP_017729342.1 PREDICTED: stonin-2 isoform X1 [Rhinopithecus bieti]XP_017729343.1 PREDICTED: stonin-2 isoform X1 [Rhinopithecus bieti]XP_017729344.1 PREDICTED: stonin-2 isoform X1 [Rhinopithecus bieti]
MTTLDHVIATHQSEWVSFNEEPRFPAHSQGGTEEHLPGLSSSPDQSESSSGENHVVDGGSQDHSHSEQDDSSEKMGLISEAASPPGSPEQPPPDLASAISSWVQFEDDTPWASTSPPHHETAETALPLTIPCWTCPSFDSLGRCPLTSESSWTTHSEDTSSPSFGCSYTDLQLINAEEQTSGQASGADSTDKRTEWQTGRQTAVSPVQACSEHTSTHTHRLDPSPPSPQPRRSQNPDEGPEGASAPNDNSSSLQEDEEIEMEAISWQAGSPAMNGHPAPPVTSARFPSWVTFDDNEISCPLAPITSPLKPNTPPSASVIPDVPYNSMGSFKKRDRPKSTLMNVSKVQKLDISSLNRTPSVAEAPPWRATNPFLNETLQDVQPSPINPFSAFFEEQERRSQNSSISSTTGKSQRDSLIVIYQDAISFDDSSKTQSHSDAVEKLKQLQIDDPDHFGSAALPDDDPIAWIELDAHPPGSAWSQPRDGWPMMLRIPEKKNIMSSRHWGPIYVKLTDAGYLQLYYEQGLEKPFREFKLEICHEISEPRLQNYDENGRIHSLRIDRVTYKEKKKYQPKPAVAHTAEREQVIKLGTTNYDDFLSFIHAVQDRLMDLPVLSMDLSTVGLNYLEEEITVDVRDEFSGTVSKGDNQILQHHVLTRIHILSFLSGLAECRLGLNDILIKGNEIVLRQDIMPTTTTKWIKLHECRFHGCVDEDVFHNSRVILFNPLDACRFELMRFRTLFAEKTLPFTLRTAASVNGAEVEVQSWLRMSTGFSSNRDPLTQVPCENVMIRYPVPSEWVKNFRRESVLGEKSLKAKVNRGASFGSTSVSGSEPVMRVTLGTAKYEHAFNSIVWRINRLPDKNSASGHPHCFFCHLELGSDREVPSRFANHVNVEFSMPTTSASKASVRSISVEDKTDVRKWVNYSAHYSYQVALGSIWLMLPSPFVHPTTLPYSFSHAYCVLAW